MDGAETLTARVLSRCADLRSRAVASIRALAAEVASELESMKSQAEEAHSVLAMRLEAALRAASGLCISAGSLDNVRWCLCRHADTLTSSIDRVSARKVAALEEELVAIDITLERAITEFDSISEGAVVLPSDADASASAAAFDARLEALSAILDELPAGPVELGTLRLDLPVGDVAELLTAAVAGGKPELTADADDRVGAIIGFLVSPRGAKPADVRVVSLPPVLPTGAPLWIGLGLSESLEQFTSSAADDVSATLTRVGQLVRVIVAVSGVTTRLVPVSYSVISSSRLLDVCIDFPCVQDVDVALHVAVAGRRITAASDEQRNSFFLRVVQGVNRDAHIQFTELRCLEDFRPPAIFPHGLVYIAGYPRTDRYGNSMGTLVHAFDSYGKEIAHPNIALLLPWRITSILAVDSAIGPLLVCVLSGSGHVRVTAMLESSVSAARETPVEELWVCDIEGILSFGAAAYPRRGVILVEVTRSGSGCYLDAVDILTGAVRGSAPIFDLSSRPAIDDTDGTVFFSGYRPVCERSAQSNSAYGICVGRWDGAGLVMQGSGWIDIEDGIKFSCNAALAVVPVGPWCRSAHLVACVFHTRLLLVFKLPERVLVHRYDLGPSACVTALAAEPSGTVLLVANSSEVSPEHATYFIEWPLPGMPGAHPSMLQVTDRDPSLAVSRPL